MALLSLTGKRWVIHETGAVAESVVEMLLRRRKIEALGEGEILESVGENARQFRDFEKAADRIAHAIASKESISIFGDYDCDGITSTALLARFFHRRNVRPLLRLPHRLKEGYGLQNAAVDELKAAGVRLLITVDTGVTAVEPIARLRDAGIDVIVLDHHTLPEILPPAFAILHPELAEPRMTPSPCGAGIAWSMISAMEEQDGHADWPDRASDMALAAIGTVADVVELRGGNRTLTFGGLQALMGLTEGPLALLSAHAGLQKPFTSRDIAFRIAPRINAAGRMDDPHIALHALLGDTGSLLQLDALNRERQDVVSGHIEDLLPLAEAETGSMLCFVSEEYSAGICGLLASRVCEMHGKPSLVAAQSGDICTASLRSIPGYDVTAGLARCSDLLMNFGGHAMAAGCTFAAQSFSLLRERLQADALAHIAEEHFFPAVAAECALDIRHVTMELCDALQVLEPFGQGNPEPRFVIESATLENIRCVGKDGKHLQATVRGRKLIGFSMGHLEKNAGQPLDLLCRVGIDTWQGRRNVQLFLDDMRVTIREPISLPS